MRRIVRALIATAATALVLYVLAYVYFNVFATGDAETCRQVAQWDIEAAVRPMGLAWRDQHLYVVDAEDGAVHQYLSRSRIAEWTGFERPIAIAATESAVYVADFLADQIVKLDREGTVVTRWGRYGIRPGEFDAPAGIAADARGNVYVSDFYNHRIQKFDRDGRFLGEWGERGRTRGRFRWPTGLAVSAQGDVAVADAFNNRIQVFTPEGRYLRQWGGIGFGFGSGWPGWFRLPKELALDASGNVYVADAFNRRIQKFTPEGELLAVWEPDGPEFRYASAVTVATDGTVYVSDFYSSGIREVRCE